MHFCRLIRTQKKKYAIKFQVCFSKQKKICQDEKCITVHLHHHNMLAQPSTATSQRSYDVTMFFAHAIFFSVLCCLYIFLHVQKTWWHHMTFDCCASILWWCKCTLRVYWGCCIWKQGMKRSWVTGWVWPRGWVGNLVKLMSIVWGYNLLILVVEIWGCLGQITN